MMPVLPMPACPTAVWPIDSTSYPNPKPRILSALCILNETSGNGRAVEKRCLLLESFHRYFPTIPKLLFAQTVTHRAVVKRTTAFLQESEGPWLLLAAGGSGTSRAILQGVMQVVQRGQIDGADVHLGMLRLGSGNIIPRLLGVARDETTALREMANDLYAGRRQPCAVYRISFPDAPEPPLFGFTMAGVGAFGQVPTAVAQWRKRHPRWMAWLTRRWGLEKVNTWQYLAAIFGQALRQLPKLPENQATFWQDGRLHTRSLFAGMLLNFDFPQLPFRVDCRIGEPRLRLALLPAENRRQLLKMLLHWRQLARWIEWLTVTPERPLTIRLPNQKRTVIAVDEDTFNVPTHMQIDVVGQVQIVARGRAA